MAIEILSIFGTRPEAIKLAPILQLLKDDPRFNSKVCITGQHREMLISVLDFFEITPDFDLDVMSHNQSLTNLASLIIEGLGKVFKGYKPDVVIVHGDTTSTALASLGAFYCHIPIVHIEAGLRTGDIQSPWPEEANRKITTVLSAKHFCPTEEAKLNLLNEGVVEADIFVTGNTVVDALLMAVNKIEHDLILQNSLKSAFSFMGNGKKNILVTCHRRENHGDGIKEICMAIEELSLKFKNFNFVYPVHLNPNIKDPVYKILSGIDNVYLVPPQEYINFVYLMINSYLIITDSGGIQEEAPSINKPVLLIRENTERPEAVLAGVVRLIGTMKEGIVSSVEEILSTELIYLNMIKNENPYGDGTASLKILNAIAQTYENEI